MLKLILFVVPLGFDTFAVAAAVGVRGLPARERLKASLVMSAFEMAMPVVGLLLGRGLGAAIGGVADYVAAGRAACARRLDARQRRGRAVDFACYVIASKTRYVPSNRLQPRPAPL